MKAARAPFFTGSLVPVAVGTSVGWYVTHQMNWGLGLVCLLGMVLLHASANMSNDYFDHLTGDDTANVEFAAPFTGGSRVIQDGLVPARQMLIAAVLCIGLASLIGIYLSFTCGPVILILGIIGIIGGFFYTAPPFRFVYKGFGELWIGLNFGVLPVLGAAYVQTGQEKFALALIPALIASVPVALLIIAILWINQFQDMNADALVGKRNWVVRLGRRRSSIVFAAMMAATYAVVLIGCAGGWLPWLAALSLLALPVAVGAVRTAMRFYDDIPHLTPANAGTIASHLATGVLLTLGIALAGRIG
jgi:1,4-dihydroxy-2-naphthoate octaprenyltransferase